jgi:aminopeptidase N
VTKQIRRLYDQFHPKSYSLELAIDAEALSFSGLVIIQGQKVGRPSKRLTFHQKGLDIKAVTVSKQNKAENQEIKIARVNKQAKFNELRLHSEELIYPGQYTVTIKFDGKISLVSMNRKPKPLLI